MVSCAGPTPSTAASMPPALAALPSRSPARSPRVAGSALAHALLVACGITLGATAGGAGDPREPFTYTAPDFRAKPSCHARGSAPPTRTSRTTGEPLRLTVTALAAREVEAQLGVLDAHQCTELFVTALAARHARFFVTTQARLLHLGDTPLRQRRWTGRRDEQELTGVIGCTRVGPYYVAVDFVDDVRNAAQSFPAIRTSLRAFLLTTRSRP